MSIKIMNLVWQSTLEGSSKRFALLALADSANDQGRILKLGVPTLCRKTGIKRSAMFTVLKQLEEDDQLIRREERTGAAGERRSSRFWINLPALRDMQLPDDDSQADADDPANPFVSAAHTPVQEMDGGYPQPVRDLDPPPVRNLDGGRPGSGPLSPSLSSDKNSVPSVEPPDRDGRTDDPVEPEPPDGYTNAASMLMRDIDLTAIDPRPRQLQQIRRALAAALAAGHPTTAVDQYFRAKVQEARTVTYLLGAFTPDRLIDITHYTKPAQPGIPPVCGQCDGRPGDHTPATRQITDRHGRPKPCPRCHPAAIQLQHAASQ